MRLHMSFYDWYRWTVCPPLYPTDEEIQNTLESSVNRDFHKNLVRRYDLYVQDIVKELNKPEREL